MRTKKACIYNARIVLPERIVKGYLLIEGSRISEVIEGSIPKNDRHLDLEMIDAQNAYVMPGMIDMHSDAIEKEIQPRPNSLFPIPMAYQELDKKLPGSGITTMYHSLSLSDDWGVRNTDAVLMIINTINDLKGKCSRIRHKIHLRYEIVFLEGISTLESLIREGSIDLMSYMDHTPGQGQFKDIESYKEFTIKSFDYQAEEIDAFLDKTKEHAVKIDWAALIRLARLAKSKGINLASHDDDSRAKIEMLCACGGQISEFPINLETAQYAKSKGIYVIVGAPNIVRGQSHTNNMRAIDAIRHQAADIICSDYLPSAMLPAVFNLVKEGCKLSDAVKMVTLNPAKALGIAQEVGSIEAGKQADLLIVEQYEDYPVVRKTLVGGKLVYQSDFSVQNSERVENAG
ncbi:MAG: alpha-D-ribose 1-methylphosphonate 5-triphosphate diphosphatase [Desulfitobacterium sp.]